jgi:uncharacterized repeat protein (TIGR03803 family)
MKSPRQLFPLALIFFGALLTVHAQSAFTTLYDFSALDVTGTTNSDGAVPFSGLVLSNSRLYGTSIIGGALGRGTLYAINANGTGFTNLHNFTAGNDGDRPSGGLILSGHTLFGTAFQAGSSGSGNVFAINTDGTGFTVLYGFSATVFNQVTFVSTNGDGSNPLCTLVLSGSTLYGTANGGGVFGHGTVFGINTNIASFTNLHNFSSTTGVKGTNSDGSGPYGALVLAGGALYGTTFQGGTSGRGTIFKVNTNGTGFTNLHNFSGFPNDGATPEGGLLIAGKTLYGTTTFGGGADNGTVFAVNTDGTDFTNLHFFTAFSHGTNADGANPKSTLIVSGDTLYGTATAGGATYNGTVFTLSTNSTGFTTVYNFTALDAVNNITNSDGSGPTAGLTASGSTFYGAAGGGGASGDGTVFAVSLGAAPPLLVIAPVGDNVVLFWPTAASNFGLQTSTDLLSGGWSNISSGIFTAGTNFVFTNGVSRPTAFFRLQGL